MDEQNINSEPQENKDTEIQNREVQSEESTEESLPVDEESFSVGDGIVGVFTSPKETFFSLSKMPKKTYWVIPLLIVIVVGLLSNFLRMNDNELTSKMQTMSAKKIQEQMDDKVKKGEITQEQANQQMEQALKFSDPKNTFFKIISYVSIIFRVILFSFLLTSLFAFIILKILQGEFNYTNILNVIAFALLIAAAADIVNAVLSILMGDFKSISLGLLFKPEAIGDKLYNFLNTIDVFTIWYTAVLSIGLAAISKLKTLQIFVIMLVIFIGLTAFFTFAF